LATIIGSLVVIKNSQKLEEAKAKAKAKAKMTLILALALASSNFCEYGPKNDPNFDRAKAKLGV
jgi:hypothetical protein